MILGFNIVLLLALILPPLIYAVIIYLTSPVGSVSFRNGLLFMVGGIGSISVLHLLWLLIPGLIPSFYEEPFEKFSIRRNVKIFNFYFYDENLK